MSPLSNYADTQLNKLLFGATAFSPPATIYVGLSTTTPAADGTGVTEPSALNGYARVAVTNDGSHWHPLGSQPATGQEQANLLAIAFPLATGDWGVCTYAVLYDQAAAGNFLAFAQLTNAQHPIIGDTPSFAIDALTITLQ